MSSDPRNAAVMEEDDFDQYEIDEEFRRIFWLGQVGTLSKGVLNDDQDLRIWLKSLLEEDDLDRYKDVVFVVGDKGQERTVRAHRLILMTRSRKFAEILEGESDSSRAIKISGVDAGVFETIVHYVYLGQIEAPSRVLQTVDLMHASAQYGITPLYNIIRLFLQKHLPKIRMKHFIMITQRVLDLNLIELDPACFVLVEARTDQVVQDPMFLRVSSRFIARLLELDNFSGITEAAVFARVLEWATLRAGGSLLADVNGDLTEGGSGEEMGFHLTRPDVRNVLEPFIRSFRLTSVPKDDLACLVKNSGVFTEHEQLVVSYYLLDQTKNLEDFSMKPRGTKLGAKRTDNARPAQNAQPKPFQRPTTHKHVYPENQRHPEPAEIHRATLVEDTQKPVHNHAEHHSKESKQKTRDMPIGMDHQTPSININDAAPPPDELVVILARPESSEEVKIIHNGGHRHESPPPTRHKTPVQAEQEPSTAVHIPNPDFSIQHITTKPAPAPPTTPKLLDRIRQQLSTDKAKTKGENGKEKKGKLTKSPSGRTIETASVKDTSSSSSSSSDNSAPNSPTLKSRHSMNVDGDAKETGDLLNGGKKSKPSVAKRPKSMVDVNVLVDDTGSLRESTTGSVGKKGGIRAGFRGLMGRKDKWSPDNGRSSKEGKELSKPAPPPRVKSVSDLSHREVVAEI